MRISGELPAVEAEAEPGAAAGREPEGVQGALADEAKWFGGRFDAERLEETLSYLGGQGWTVQVDGGRLARRRQPRSLVVLL